MDGEVVSCDSMQVYRGMDIGTAKPTWEERQGIPHHMIDVADPCDGYSAAHYARAADRAVRDIMARGKRPIVAGGTGLYLRALTLGLHDSPPGFPDTSARWEAFLAEHGQVALHRALGETDPEAAARLAPGDTRRVLRALVVYSQTGKTLTRHHDDSQQRPARYRPLVLGLRMDREALYQRIETRVDEMMSQGLLEEVRGLAARLPPDCTAMQAIGYKELLSHLGGECTREEAVARIKQATRHLAKRQMTWFTHQEKAHWLDAEASPLAAAMEALQD